MYFCGSRIIGCSLRQSSLQSLSVKATATDFMRANARSFKRVITSQHNLHCYNYPCYSSNTNPVLAPHFSYLNHREFPNLYCPPTSFTMPPKRRSSRKSSVTDIAGTNQGDVPCDDVPPQRAESPVVKKRKSVGDKLDQGTSTDKDTPRAEPVPKRAKSGTKTSKPKASVKKAKSLSTIAEDATTTSPTPNSTTTTTKRTKSGASKKNISAPTKSIVEEIEEATPTSTKIKKSKSLSALSSSKKPSAQGVKRSKSGNDTNAAGKTIAAKPRPIKKPVSQQPIVRDEIPRKSTESYKRVLRILSLNVGSLRPIIKDDERTGMLKTIVKDEQPDILCFNEHKLKLEDVEEWGQKLREVLPEFITLKFSCSTAKKGYSGVAVMLRKRKHGIVDPEAITITEGFGKDFEHDSIITHEGRILTIELPEITVVSAYVPNSGQDLSRLEYRCDDTKEQCWDRDFAIYLKQVTKRRKLPVVVIGDLNVCHNVRDMNNMYVRPNFPKDLEALPVAEQYKGLSQLFKSAGFTPQERVSFSKHLLADAGLVDTFRALYPEKQGVFSYYSARFVHMRPLNRGLRLDYVLASKEMCEHLVEGKLIATDNEGRENLPASDGVATEDVKKDSSTNTNKEETKNVTNVTTPQVLDSFVLDHELKISDHTAVGCCIALP
eukprot:m.49636 g.49636  ORF g.49636 m.49636 type:complete len:662 (+) comp21076_c0_seq1:64-2049(+)